MNKHERWLVNREIESYKEGKKHQIFHPESNGNNPDMWWFALLAAAVMIGASSAGCIQKTPEKPPVTPDKPGELVGPKALPYEVFKKDIKYEGKNLTKKDYKDLKDAVFNYFKNNDGDKSAKGAARQGGSAYHVFEQDQKHLKNSAATTSETEALFFNALAMYKASGGNVSDLDKEALKELEKMMPHDGYFDQEHAGKYLPKLAQWLRDVSGKGTGDGVVGKGKPYDVYSTYDKDGKDTGSTPQESWHSKDVYKYSSATDADQWLLEGLYWELQDPGVPAQEKMIYAGVAKELAGSLHGLLAKEGKYQNIMPFSHAWGKKPAQGDWNGEWQWTAEQAYSGYQVPSVWYILGFEKEAKDQVSFLKAAQDAYDAQDSTTSSGWFMPAYNIKDNGFGKAGTFTWNGYDPNTNWAQYQYRTFAHLAHYYYLSGDPDAKVVLDKFYDNVKENFAKDAQDRLLIPTDLAKGSESINTRDFDAGSFGLVSQGLTYMAAKSGDDKYRADSEFVLDELKTHANTDGEKAGSYSNADGTYGFQNAEVLIAYGLHDELLD